MKNILDYSLEEIQKIVKDLNLPNFRAMQIYEGVMRGKNFNEITTLPDDIKQTLQNEYRSQTVTIIDKAISKDGTIKFMFKLHDNNVIEGVLMKYKYGYSICISTQIGCKMGCKFCASGLNGIVRDLTAGEILGQVIVMNEFLGGGLNKNRKITNVVLMGSGEPLDNYKNVTKFIRLLNRKEGLKISQRNISLSTCGLTEGIKRLADDGFNITLTISLHASNDLDRQKIMPIAKKYSIKEILEACKYYFNKTGRRIVFEYVLVKDTNDSKNNVDQLSRLLRGFPSHVNVICLNTFEESEYKATTREEALAFVNQLRKKHMSATLRRNMGSDIQGACGQLRRSYLEKQDKK